MLHLLDASGWRPPVEAPRHCRRNGETTRWLQQRTTWISFKNPLGFEPKAKAGVTERKRERDGRKSREVSRAASSPAAVQVQASGTRDRDLQK